MWTRSAPESLTAKREASPPPPAASSSAAGGAAGLARLSGRTAARPPPELAESPPEEPSRIASSATAPATGTRNNTPAKRGRRPARPRRRRGGRRPRRRLAPPVSSGGRWSVTVRGRPQQAPDHGDCDHDQEEERYHGQDVEPRGGDHADRQRGKQHYERQDGYQTSRLQTGTASAGDVEVLVNGVAGCAVGTASPLGEELDEDQAEGESADVRKVRGATAVASDLRRGELPDRGQELEEEPYSEH